ncbi:T9SS type A sorting domain-containing protein [Flavobacteriaceae bacterium 14752]|uniref:T9SS type A sorting domain-containing protein n=1 Tax=Mesohalobacter salilacus TaxID=2491711 RepID=UPI000F63ABFF|nr:T9SS C-terminal target domain-containing protein [Flavobacteriaceae bacterium 14752]
MTNFYYKNIIILFAFFGVIGFSFAQNYDGPGGVGSDADNRFWFDANSINQAQSSTVQTWTNQGGNANSLTQSTADEQPLLNLNGLNNQSELIFDGTNDFFDLANNSDLNTVGPWNERSFVLVFTTGTDITTRQVLYEEGGAIRGFNIYIENGNLFFSAYDQLDSGIGSPWGDPDIEQISTPISPIQTYILTIVYEQDGGDNTNGSFTGYLNNFNFETNNNIGILYSHAGDINLSGNGNSRFPDGDSLDLFPFSGSISEYIIYNRALNNSERTLINNYLSSKYNIPLLANNEFLQDDVSNGNFDFNVVGIKRENAQDFYTTTNYGTGIVKLSSSNLTDGDFLYVGTDLLEDEEVSARCSEFLSSNSVRFNSTWRVSKNGGFNFDLDLDISDVDNNATSSSDVIMLIDDNPSFTSPTVVSSSSLGVSEANFGNINLNNGDYFTFEILKDRSITSVPAGMQKRDNLKFWFNANTLQFTDGNPVNVFDNTGENSNDASQNNASQQPIYNANSINGNAALTFDGVDNFLSISSNLDINNGVFSVRTISIALKTGDDVNTRQSIYEEGGGLRGLHIYIFNGEIYVSGWNLVDQDGTDSPWGFVFLKSAINPNTSNVVTLELNGNSSQTGTFKGYLNGSLMGTQNNIGRLYTHNIANLGSTGGDGSFIETGSTSSNLYFDGQIAEVVFFNSILNEEELNLLHNHLSSKYNTPFSSSIDYVYDSLSEGDFDFNLIGVGKTNSLNDQASTNFDSGVIALENPSSLDDADRIIVASDSLNQTDFGDLLIDCTSTESDGRTLQTKWRTQVEGNPGTIDVILDFSNLNTVIDSSTDIDLIVDDNPDFNSPTRYSANFLCSTIQYEKVILNDGDYFTFQLKEVEPVKWDGTSYANGSGTFNEPNTSDFDKKFVVDGTGAVLNDNFDCFCMHVSLGSDISLNGLNANISTDLNNLGSISADNLTVDVGGNITNTGSLSFATTHLSLVGTDSAQEITGNGFENEKITLDNSLGAVINLDTNDTLSVNSSVKLLNGNLNTNGQLLFKSTDTQTAILEPVENTASISGDVIVERRIPQSNRAFRYISSPVNTTGSIRDNLQEGANNPDTSTNNNPNPGFGTHITGSQNGANGFDATGTGNSSMFSWDVSGQAWIPIPNTDIKTLNVDESYALLIRGDRSTTLNSNTAVGPATTLRFTGTLETGTRAVGAANLSGNIGDFNLIANPYQAQVDLTTLLDVASTSDVNTNFAYVYDPTIGTRGGYATIDLNAGTTTGEDLVDATPAATDANEFLQPNQAFFIETTGASPSITYEENDKSVSSLTTATFSTSETTPLVNIDLKRANNNVLVDGIKLKFNDNYSDQVDNDDAAKAWNFDESITFYNGGNYMSINKRTQPAVNDTVQLFTFNYQEQNYSLDLTLNDLNPEATVYLKDNYLDYLAELTPNTLNTYNFSVDNSIPASTDGFRFSLVFDVETLSIDDNTLKNNLRLYPNPVRDNQFIISSQQLIGQSVNIDIVNLTGQLIYSDVVDNANKDIRIQPNQQLSTGVYIVKISTSDTEMSRKIIVE